MLFVSEEIIDELSVRLGDSEDATSELLAEISQEQPALLPFVLGENEEAFSQSERDLLVYLLLVVWKSARTVNGPQAMVDPDALSAAEERNWELLEGVQAKRFRDRLDVFFEDAAQEDLLAFLEDVLSEDEEDVEVSLVTREGREPIFVLLKSVVDCLEEASQLG